MNLELATPAYSRLDPDASAALRRRRAAAQATKTQSAVEYILFGVFGLTVVLTAIALFALNSPSHRLVPNRVADGLRADRVNVLLIGTSTKTRPSGEEVAIDSLMLLSLKPSTHQTALLSIPRDLYVKLARYGEHRLASAHTIGDASGYPGEGAGLTTDTVEQVIGEPVHAFIRLDGPDLMKAIDRVGGVDIRVARGLYEYKTRDRFTAGMQHLDGARAFRYAMSPYVVGPQADRFARQARQAQVIGALVTKLSETNGRADWLTAAIGGQHSTTNLTPEQLAMVRSVMTGSSDVAQATLEPLVDVQSVDIVGDAAREVVRPRGGDFNGIRQVARDLFAGRATAGL